jgi:hypothetical protein
MFVCVCVCVCVCARASVSLLDKEHAVYAQVARRLSSVIHPEDRKPFAVYRSRPT